MLLPDGGIGSAGGGVDWVGSEFSNIRDGLPAEEEADPTERLLHRRNLRLNNFLSF